MQFSFCKYVLLALCFSGLLLNTSCGPSKEEKRKIFIAEHEKLFAKAQSFYNRLNEFSQTLSFPQKDQLSFEYKPEPALNLEMRTSNAVWFQVAAKPHAGFSPDFKLTDIIPASVSTSALNIWQSEKTKKTDSEETQPTDYDTSGLGMFTASLDTRRTPYAIFIRELTQEETEVEKKDFLKYSFEGGRILVAVWVADIEKKKIIGSYFTIVQPTEAWHISSLGDETPEDAKNEKMKVEIYRAACLKAYQNIKEDIEKATNE